MEWKFKIIKSSTYNSLKEQLKLKDAIISQKDNSLNVETDLRKIAENNYRLTKLNIREQQVIEDSLNTQISTLEDMVTILQERNSNQSITITSLTDNLSKYIRLRDLNGRFIKIDKNEKV